MRLLLELPLFVLVLPLPPLILVTRTRRAQATSIRPQRRRCNRARKRIPRRRRQHTIPLKPTRPSTRRLLLRTRTRSRTARSISLHEARASVPRYLTGLAQRGRHDSESLRLGFRSCRSARAMGGSAGSARRFTRTAAAREGFVLASLGLIALDAGFAGRLGAAALQFTFYTMGVSARAPQSDRAGS